MKVTNIKDIEKFFKVIDSCKGRVELVTGEGDRLNLKSKLSQIILPGQRIFQRRDSGAGAGSLRERRH